MEKISDTSRQKRGLFSASVYFRSASGYLGLKLVIFSATGLIGQYLLTHYLLKKDYGLLIWVSTVVSLLSFFGLPGISTSITGAVAKGFDGNFRKGTLLELAGGTLGGVVLLGFAGYYWFFDYDQIKAVLFLVAGVLGPGLWLDTHLCYWNGKKNFRAIFMWSIPVRLIQLLLTALVLFFSSNPLWVFVAQNVIYVIANIGAALWIMGCKSTNMDISGEYQSFGVFSTKLYLVGSFVAYLDKLVIGFFFGLESLAVFTVGELLYTYMYKTPGAILAQILHPKLAEMNVNEAARWIKKKQFYLIGGMAASVIIIGVAIPFAYPLLFSEKYNDSIFYAHLFLLCIMMGTPIFLKGTLLKAHALKNETMKAWLILALSPLILVPVLGWFFGLTGIVLSRGITNGVVSGYYYFLINRLAKG